MAATALYTAGSRSANQSKAAAPAAARVSLWAVLSQALEMAHVVGEYGSVSPRQMRRVQELAKQF